MPNRLLRTSGFRIAVVYLALLGATLLVLLAFIYWSTAGLIERQVDETVEAELRGLAEQYRDEGLGRLVQVVAERSGAGGNPQSIYLLTDPRLNRLAGNLRTWPDLRTDPQGWLEVRIEPVGGTGEINLVRGRAFELVGGYRLFVGRDTVSREQFRDNLLRALAWAAVPALVFGLVGGALIGRYSLRRVEAVRETGEEIVSGDLSRRVPLNGSGDEFDRLAGTINRMLDQIDTLMTGMRTVTDSLAHDLRSPLTHARSGIEMALRREGGVEDYRRVLEQTNAEIETVLHTFESLISIAHAEAGLNRLALTPLDLSGLVGDLAELYRPIAEDAGLELAIEAAPEMSVEGHRQLLGQALANLLDNAIKFTPAGGRVAVTLTREDGSPVLAVADTGPGIPEGDRERVLDRFVRLDEARGAPGSGLGLSLVAAVAKLHGARLALADNAPGLRVTLTFGEGERV